MAVLAFSNVLVAATLTTSTNVYAILQTPQTATTQNTGGLLISGMVTGTTAGTSNGTPSIVWDVLQGPAATAVASNAIVTTVLATGSTYNGATSAAGYYNIPFFAFVPNWVGQFQAVPTGSTSAFIPTPYTQYTLALTATFTGTAPTVTYGYIKVESVDAANVI
jgi:hypothetical protein